MRRLLGLTGQYAAVDEVLTGRENLVMFGRLFGLPARRARRRAQELLEHLDLLEAADRPARTYSGGMRRRLDLASSLLTRPRILFLDEPTAGLDPRSRNQIWTILRELVREGTTLLLTTQYLEEAEELAARIAVIDHGRVIAEGTGSELKDRIGGQILEVELASAPSRRQAEAVLASVGCGEPEPEVRPDRLTVPAPGNGLELIEDAARALREAQIGVSHIGLRGPTLDDVFLRLTGTPPSGNGNQPAAGSSQPAAAASIPREDVPRVVDLLFHMPAGAIDRRARPKLRDVVPDTVVTVAVTVDRHRPAPPHRLARALPDLCQRRDRRPDPDVFQRTPGLLEKLLPVGERRYVSGTVELYDGMLQMVHPDRVVAEADLAKLPLVEPVYPLTEGLSLNRCARPPMPRSSACPICRNGRTQAWVSRERFPPFAEALRTRAPPGRAGRHRSRKDSPGRGSPMTNSWPASLRSRWCARTCAVRPAAPPPATDICARS